MKLCKYIICIGISLIYNMSVLCGEKNNQMQSANSSNQEKKTIATFESINKWKATLSSKPVTHIMKRQDGTEAQLKCLLFYVETTNADTSETRRIWQYEHGIIETAIDWDPRNFIFGPADDNKFCLAFVITGSLRFFKLDPNSTISQYKEDSIMLDASLFKIENDPNTIIPLHPIDSERIIPSYSPNTIFIDSVCGYENYAVFNLTIREQKFILRYSVDDGKPVYSVYKLNDLTK